MLGDVHLRMLTIVGFPSATCPGVLDELNRLAFAYRWSTRAHARQDRCAKLLIGDPPPMVRQAQVDRRHPEGGDDQRGFGPGRQRRPSNKAGDADLALQDLGGDMVGYALSRRRLVSGTRIPARPTRSSPGREGRPGPRLHRHQGADQRGRGLARQLPGQTYANVRQPPLSTLNLAHMAPLSAVWAGPQSNEHLDGPPLLIRQHRRLDAVSDSRSMSVMSATPWWLARPAPARACCWR
jgi:hypothetical protein